MLCQDNHVFTLRHGTSPSTLYEARVTCKCLHPLTGVLAAFELALEAVLLRKKEYGSPLTIANNFISFVKIASTNLMAVDILQDYL